MATWVVIAEAIPHTNYTPEHISWLIRHGKIVGRKAGGVWLVELESLKEYESRMNELGPQKFNPVRDDPL